MGWFGWTLLSVILVTTVLSVGFFYTMFQNHYKIPGSEDHGQGNEKESENVSGETLKNVEHVQQTIGRDHRNVGEFVSDMHAFYNQTTGYGRIDSINWIEHQQKAEQINTTIKGLKVKHDPLKKDLQHIQELAEQVLDTKKQTDVRDLHRMFHDLDIALNHYNGYDKIWHVTETLQ